MRIFTLLLFMLISTLTLVAQVTKSQDEFEIITEENNAQSALQEREISSTGLIIKTVNIFPNPCPDRILFYTPVNLSVISYQVYKSTGEIVEIENLIGKDDRILFIDLSGALPGIYFVTFETNVGPVTKYFVIP